MLTATSARPQPSPVATAAKPLPSKTNREFAIVALIAVLLLGGGGWWIMKIHDDNAEKARLAEVARVEAERKTAEEKAAAKIESERINTVKTAVRTKLAEARIEWEGCYLSGSSTDPTGPVSGSNRVNRGGSYYNEASVPAPPNATRSCRTTSASTPTYASPSVHPIKPAPAQPLDCGGKFAPALRQAATLPPPYRVQSPTTQLSPFLRHTVRHNSREALLPRQSGGADKSLPHALPRLRPLAPPLDINLSSVLYYHHDSHSDPIS